MDDLYSLCMVMKTKDQGETNAETVFLNRAIVDSTPIWFSQLSFFTKQTQIEKGSAEVPTPHQPKACQVSNEGILRDICKWMFVVSIDHCHIYHQLNLFQLWTLSLVDK